ncbi:MAG: AAA family ATPase [Anaerolineales bacterium]|nr:AAA family ATPase [Anaerolineales bacterium]
MALYKVLDDNWTIYVQPFLNGLEPDIIIFSEQSGLGVFEVKDWQLENYEVDANGRWSVYKGGRKHDYVRCPFEQVEQYKETIMRYELPELEAAALLNRAVYGVVVPFIYIHKHTTDDALKTVGVLQEKHEHTIVFGKECIKNPKELLDKLDRLHLKRRSNFADMMQNHQLQNRLRDSLAYPEHGRREISDILFKLSKRQESLLSNDPGKRRVIGAAGSGKTMILARKAVNAALEGKKVLLVCYNITMVNYLNVIVRRLARHFDKNQQRIDRLIYVRHFHRLFPSEKNIVKDRVIRIKQPFDVILIDEGQDFEREWIEKLYRLAKDDAHIMFVEDDRQNIYGKDTASRRQVPGIRGRPFELKATFRVNAPVVKIANRLIAASKQTFESGDMETVQEATQQELFPAPIPTWFNGNRAEMLNALASEAERLIHHVETGAFADIVILVCSVEDGWDICDELDKLNRPYICNFESRSENEQIREQYAAEQTERRIDDLRRGRKIAFRMQTGRIKICTIHSFKGWELKRVLVFFNPVGPDTNHIPLLYTAMTRSQEFLTIFNAHPDLIRFSQQAAAQNLLTLETTTDMTEAS